MATQPILIPFDTLPACARLCGKLFDVNGACVPPEKPGATEDQMKECFCSDDRLAGFKTGTEGVCDPPCTGTDTKENTLSEIQKWYAGFCGVEVAVDGQAPAPTTAGGSSGSGKSSGGGGDWLSSHWQWVVMLVILVVGIAGVWIGACIWRRHHLKKKERANALGKHAPGSSAIAASWGPGAAPPNGVFMSSANGQQPYTENRAKRVSKWIPKDRT